MAIPALRVPLGLDTAAFEKGIKDAKSLTNEATDFILKSFAKQQLKLVVNSDQFKPQVQAATKFLGDEFAKIKPQIQSITQASVKETTELGLKTAAVIGGPAIKGSFQAFSAVALPAIGGVTQALGPMILKLGAAAAAIYVVVSAINAAREQIVEMVAVADKASSFGTSTTFLQLFEAESRKVKVTVEEMDAALTHAFQAGKDKSPIDVSKWELAKERVSDVELALRVYNAEVKKSTGKDLEGLIAFRDAKTQDDKIKAILQTMKELNAAGQQLASLELGDKFFGTEFTDKIRQGKTSVDSILDTMEKIRASQDGIFPAELVARAKEVDDQLKLSHERLSRSLKPTWDDIASVILTIKGYWADVVDLVARAVEFANKIRIPLPFGLGGDGSQALITGAAGFKGNTGYAPMESRGAGAAPTLKGVSSDRDSFDKAIEQANKRIAVLQAEAKAIDDTTAARDRAKLVASLEEAAIRANTAAGLKNTEATAAQREEINKAADAMERATAAHEKAKVLSDIRFGAGTAFLSQSDVAIAQQLKGLYGADIPGALASTYAAAIRVNEGMREISNTISTNLVTALANVADGTKTAGQAFQDFGKIVIRALEEAIIKLLIVGPLMRALQGGATGLFGGLFGGGGPGTAGSAFFGPVAPAGFGPGGYTGYGGRDDPAGIVHRGEYVLNQDAVSRIGIGNLDRMNRGYAEGGVVGMPGIAGGWSGDGGSRIVYAPHIDARGADVAAVAKLAQVMAEQRKTFTRDVINAVIVGRKGRHL